MSTKEKIGIFGSAAGVTEEINQKARQLGEALAAYDVILITGACSGLPYEAVNSARKVNSEIEIWGYSPAYDYEEQVSLTPGNDNDIYSKLIYTSRNVSVTDITSRRKYRNVLSTDQCDAGIIISGQWGTLNEFTNLFDMGKVVGVLIDTGGVADLLLELSQKISKPSKAKVIFNSDPTALVSYVLKMAQERK